MVLRRIVSFVLASVLCLFLAFSVGSINAVAALSGGRYMTPQESLDVFGSEISFTYYDGTDYTQSSFLYNTTVSMGTTSGELPDNWSDYTAATYLEYVATVQSPVPVANPNYITVNILPTYSIFDTEQITSLIALSSMNSSVSTVYQSPSWDWSIGGTTYHFENDLDDGNGLYSSIQFRQHFQSTFVPMQFIGSVSTSGYSYRAQFSGNTVGGSSVAGAYRYKYYLYIMCPYISTDASGSFGTVTTTSGSNGNVNVDVNVDMEETNSLLSDILGGLGSIVSGIGNLFIPDESVFSDFWSDLEQAIYDKLDPLYTVCVQIDRVFTNIRDSGAGTHFHIDTVEFPVGDGQTMTLGGWDVPIVPDIPGNNVTDGLMWTCKKIISIVCTIAFINMCKDKIALFFNPDAERID